MPVILDTQIIIWLEESPEKIPDDVKEIILRESLVYISAVSVWEMAIKIKTGKLDVKMPLQTFISNVQKDYGFDLLNISLAHIYQIEQLPLYHKDPFDRLLIAQSMVEKIAISTSDEIFNEYGINIIWK